MADIKTRVRRLPERGEYSREAVNAILDEGLVCHAGFVEDGQPYVIPTAYARDGDALILHGSAASRLLRTLAGGVPACVTVTLLDGLVLARSAFHHSMNYRSAVLFGTAQLVADREEKLRALEVLTEHLVPGRWAEVRHPSEQELKATAVLAMPIDHATAKIRSGPPKDDDADYGMDVWAGLLPFARGMDEPAPDPKLTAGIVVPEYVRQYRRG